MADADYTRDLWDPIRSHPLFLGGRLPHMDRSLWATALGPDGLLPLVVINQAGDSGSKGTSVVLSTERMREPKGQSAQSVLTVAGERLATLQPFSFGRDNDALRIAVRVSVFGKNSERMWPSLQADLFRGLSSVYAALGWSWPPPVAIAAPPLEPSA
ncbi:MAG: hypothetical protein NVV74_08910 [Magnetospirillum sp.]|nr:hypothetical protein [Magnetospirillum sp.]